MGQMKEIGKTGTCVFTDDDEFTKVIYHETCVVKFNHEVVILDTGGWKTATTKARMNQASNQYNLNYKVFRKTTNGLYPLKTLSMKKTESLQCLSLME